MLSQFLAFLGSIFNLFINTIFNIGLVILVLFLSVLAIATGFAVLTIWLLT